MRIINFKTFKKNFNLFSNSSSKPVRVLMLVKSFLSDILSRTGQNQLSLPIFTNIMGLKALYTT